MDKTWLPLVFLLVPALAGCFDGSDGVSDPVVEPEWAVRAIYADQDRGAGIVEHDHEELSLHQGLSTPNFDVVAWNPLTGGYYDSPAGTAWCGAVGDRSGDRQIAVVHSFSTDVAMQVLDVTDPTDPLFIGELVMPQVFTYDVTVTEDGRYAAIAANPKLGDILGLLPGTGAPGAQVAPVPLTASFRSACGEEPVESQVDMLPYGYATILVDLEDPTRPVVADAFQDQSRNMHSVSATLIDGTHYIVSSSLQAVPCDLTGNVPCTYPRLGNLLSHFNFFTVGDGPAGSRLMPYGTYSGGNFEDFDPDLAILSNGHVDATLQKHPVTGELIAYLAHWDGGFVIVRLDGPLQISHLATWGAADDEQSGKDMFGNVHSAVPLGLFDDGRHYTLAGQEVVASLPGRSTGQVVLLDTTDPASPTPVARWTLPVELEWSGGLMFSTHYPIVVDDTLFVPLYHGGIWAADIRAEAWPELPSLGVFVPDHEPPEAPEAKSLTPYILEVLDLGDGNLLTFDGDSGAYVVRFTGPHAQVPPAAPWTEDAWIGA